MIAGSDSRARKLQGLRRRGEVVALARAARAPRPARLDRRRRRARSPCLGAADSRDRRRRLPGRGGARARARAARAAAAPSSFRRTGPGPRVFRVAGRRPIDIAEIEGGSIAADLARRDFTVNAIAVDARVRRRSWIPSAALEDLRPPPAALRPTPRTSPRIRCGSCAPRGSGATHGLAPGSRSPRGRARARRRSSAAPPPSASPASSRGCSAASGPRAGARLGRARGHPARRRWACASRQASPPRSARRLSSPRRRRDPRGSLPARRRRSGSRSSPCRLGMTALEARRWLARAPLGPARTPRDASPLVGLAAEACAAPRSARDAWRWILDAGSLGPGCARPARAPGRRGPAAGRSAGSGWPGAPPAPGRRGPATTSCAGSRIAAGTARRRAAARSCGVAAAMGEVKNRREARHWLTGQVRKAP